MQLVLALGRDHRHLAAVGVGGERGYGNGRWDRARDQYVALLGLEVVRAAGDHDVDVAEIPDEPVSRWPALEVRGQDDLVHACAGRVERLVIDGLDGVVEGVERRTRRGDGDRARLGRRDADHADPLAALGRPPPSSRSARVAQRLQRRLGDEVARRRSGTGSVGAGDGLRQAPPAEVVLAVADRGGVVADRIDRDPSGTRALAGVVALEGRAQVQAGEAVVAEEIVTVPLDSALDCSAKFEYASAWERRRLRGPS